MRMNFPTLVLLACASIAPIGLLEAAHSAEPVVSVLAPMQRTVAISKISAQTSSQAILIAERKNPGLESGQGQGALKALGHHNEKALVRIEFH